MTDSTTDRQDYLKRLILSLRVRDVPPERIREVLHEVDGHLEASGEDPMEAFGSTAELADALVEAFDSTGELADAVVEASPGSRSLRKHPLSMAAIAAGSYLAPLLLFSGGSSLLAGDSVPITLGAVAGVVVALGAVFAALPLIWGYLDSRRRMWAPVSVLTVGFGAGIGLAVTWDSRVLVDAPGWAVLATGVACVAAVALLVRADPLLPRGREGGHSGHTPHDISAARRAPFGLRRLVGRRDARLAARVLDSPSFRYVVLMTILTGGLGALAWAVSVEEPSPAATLLAGLVIGVLVGDLIGATRVRRRHGLSVDRFLD